MHILTKDMEKDFLEKNGNDGNKLSVQRKRCYEKMTEIGVKKYLEKYVESVSDLKKLVEYFSRKPWGKNKEILVDQLCEIFDSSSLINMLSKMPKNYLLQVLEDIDLKIPEGESHTPNVLANFIVYGSKVEDEEDSNDVENLEINLSSKKPSKIDSKCSRQDLHYYFKIEDLRDFCKDIGIVSYGKKVKVVNRILEYFNDKDDALKRYNPEKRRELKREKAKIKKENESKRKAKMDEKKEQAKIEKQSKMSQELEDKHKEEESPKPSKKDSRKTNSKKKDDDSNDKVEDSPKKSSKTVKKESSKSSKKDSRKTQSKKKDDDSNDTEEDNPKSKKSGTSSKKNDKEFDEEEDFEDSIEEDSKENDPEEEPLMRNPKIKGRPKLSKRNSDRKKREESSGNEELSKDINNLSLKDVGSEL